MNDERIAPKFENAPGVVVRPRRDGWAATWQPRTDIAERGCPIRQRRLAMIVGDEPTAAQRIYVSEQCNSLQADMLAWSHGGLPPVDIADAFDGTLTSLIYCYKTDPDSTYHKGRYRTRKFYNDLCRRIETDHGEELLSEIRGRQFRRWHEEWLQRGVTMAHSLMGMLRTLFGFGATLLEDAECKRLSDILHQMKFQMPKRRTSWLTAEQVVAVRAEAHRQGFPSIALAQAFQFECTFRQKDVIGEWVPLSEKEPSDIHHDGWKWLRGIRWSEIDDDYVLRHTTSKRLKDIEVDLKLAPMVMEELARCEPHPTHGPVIVLDDDSGLPWRTGNFQKHWRKIATAAGVPLTVRNMDSRAGAITEATEAEAPLEHVQQAATHSQISTTQGYSRNPSKKTANVMRIRVAHRNKTGTENG